MQTPTSELPGAPRAPLLPRWAKWTGALAGLLLLALALAWISSLTRPAWAGSLNGWPSFFAMLLACAGLIGGIWWLLQDDQPPNWLIGLVIGAALLRLGLGTLWYVSLPTWGHNTSAEKAGYVMADASLRDQQAWKLAQSRRPLTTAFTNNRKVDQYGGLLFLSALVYRYLGGAYHQPLLMIVLTAAFSALAVLMTWAFARRAWDRRVAGVAAWIMALYPEAVLLGSSQMREAFTITLTTASFYGLFVYFSSAAEEQNTSGKERRRTTGLIWMIAPLALYLPFSPPFAAFLLGLLVLTALLLSLTSSTAGSGPVTRQMLRQWRFWVIVGGVSILALAGLWLVLRQFTPDKISNPLAMLTWWLRKSASLQAFLSENASGWMQKIFKASPEWLHLPLLLAYGIMQPFLPAAMVVGSHAPIWPFITLWRAIGWTLLLALLLYAPLLSLRRKSYTSLILSLVTWLGILVAAFRGGADLWDNPRYRATFAGLQIALAAWVLVEQRTHKDPWLRRVLISVAAILAWFLPWYMRRYYAFDWPVNDFFKTLALGFITAILLTTWDIFTSKRKDRGERL